MLPFFSLFFKLFLSILQVSVVQNLLLFLFSVFFILFLFLEERKNVFLVTICSSIRYKILKIGLSLFIVFVFYLCHPFIALYALGFFACFPLLFDKKVQKTHVYFIHFFGYFLYRYFFFFGILFISFLSLFSIPVEALVINFLVENVVDKEEDFTTFAFGKGFSKASLKEVDVAKGAKKIDLLKEKQVEVTARLGEIFKNNLNKTFCPLDEEMTRRKMPPEQQLFVRDFTAKVCVNLVDTLRNKITYPPYDTTYFEKHPQILPETKDVIKSADLPTKLLPFVSETLTYFDVFKYFNYHNELIITPTLVKYCGENNIYVTSYMARILDALLYEDDKIPAGKLLEEMYENDKIPTEKIKEREGLIIIKNKAPYFKFSVGQDLRFYIGWGDNIARPIDGKTHDFDIKIGDKFYAIENKLIVTKFDKPDHEKGLKLCLEKDIIQEDHVAIIFNPNSKSMQVLKKEAIPSFDLTHQYFLFKEKVDGNFDAFVNVLVTKSTTLGTYISQGKPIIFYSKSSVEDPILIKAYNYEKLNLETKTIRKK